MCITNSTLSNNGGIAGGAISNSPRGRVIIIGSTLSHNEADQRGGAIFNASGGIVTIIDSTIADNLAGEFGGGIENQGALTITNSTLSDNRLSSQTMHEGGAINGPATITFSTLSGNTAGRGGSLSGTFSISNSIIANTPDGRNCTGTITDGGFNLDDDETCNFGNNSLNMDPQLDPAGLQQNEGPTSKTIALQPTSPARDFIPNGTNECGTTITTDQRGFVRPAPAHGKCDIGAFELGEIPVVLNNLTGFTADPDSFCTLDASFPPSRCPLPQDILQQLQGRSCLSGSEFIFIARLANKSTSPLTSLIVRVTELTNFNLVQLPTGGIGGVGATFAVPKAGEYADGVLDPGEAVDVPFVICLRNTDSFRFLVDMLGLLP